MVERAFHSPLYPISRFQYEDLRQVHHPWLYWDLLRHRRLPPPLSAQLLPHRLVLWRIRPQLPSLVGHVCGTLFIFLLISPIAFAWYHHRLGDKNFFKGLIEAFTWMPFFLIFFGGLSWHISYALLAHPFTLPIEWGSTAKELDDGGFFVGMERVWKAFRMVLIFMVG